MNLSRAFLARPFAHRGLHDRKARTIENSRGAIRAAMEAGYGVELDLQLSADGEAMVFHDAALERLTGESGPVRARAAAELARIRLTGADETIPTLGDILSLVGGRTPLLVELKDQGGRLDETGVGPLEARAAELLRAYDGPVAVMSFNPASVAEMARLAPDAPRGLTAMAARRYDWRMARARRAALAQVADYEATGCAFVSFDHRDLPTPETAALRAQGGAVLCWTVRSASEEATVRAHVDAVTFEGYRPARLGR